MGSINLDNTGSGGAITLSSDGTSLLLDGSAVGGGADLYAANPVSATDPVAGGNNSFSIGSGSSTTGADGVAIGTLAKGLNSHAKTVAIGHTAQVNTANGVAIGVNTLTYGGSGGTSIGFDARNASQWGTSIGTNSSGNGSRTITGYGAMALGGSYAFGADSFAAAIANNSSTYGAKTSNSIAMGKLARVSGGTDAVAIGTNALATGGGAVSLGFQSDATGSSAVALGNGALASALFSTALPTSTASGNYSLAAGQSSTASHGNSISLGTSVQSTATNQINLGGTADTVRISETYTLPTADGTNGQVLTTDGSGAVTFADAGGALELYAENPSSVTTPTAQATNSIAIGNGANVNSVGYHALAIGENTDCLDERSVALGSYAQVGTSGTKAISLGRSYANGNTSLAAVIGNNTSSYGASQTSTIAIGYQAKASNTYAVAIGRTAIAQGDTSLALGEAQASGVRSVAIGTTTSSGKGSTGTYAIAIGYNSASTGTGSVCLGPENTSSSQYSVAIGRSNTASGNYAAVIGSRDSTASADNSFDLRIKAISCAPSCVPAVSFSTT